MTCGEQNRRSRIIDFYQTHPIMVALTYLPFYLLGFFLVERLVGTKVYPSLFAG